MPVIWSSSERPMSVRVVWVDGVRHAILSPDDPLLNIKIRRQRRRGTSAAAKDKGYPLKFEPYDCWSPGDGRLDGCLLNSHLVVSNRSSGRFESSVGRTLLRRQSAPTGARTSGTSPDCGADESAEPVANDEEDSRCENFTKKIDSMLEDDRRAGAFLFDSLLRRVLQWLEFTKKAQSSNFENIEREVADFRSEQLAVCKERNSSSERESPDEHVSGVQAAREEGKRMQRPEAESDSDGDRSYFLENPRFKVTKEIGSSESMWTPPDRPHLHIFMPNLEKMKKHLMSSQESIFSTSGSQSQSE